jgi:hypothetical protein
LRIKKAKMGEEKMVPAMMLQLSGYGTNSRKRG